MILSAFFVQLLLLGSSTSLAEHQKFADLRRALGPRTLGLTHAQLDAMLHHDAEHKLSAHQNLLVCGDYEDSATIKAALESRFGASEVHPVFVSNREGRSCFSVTGAAASSTDAATLTRELGSGASAHRIPHALKFDRSVIDTVQHLTDKDQFTLELMYGLGVGTKGLGANRDSKSITRNLMGRMKSVLTDASAAKAHLSSFFWSSDAANGAAEHAIAKAFAPLHESAPNCHLDKVHVQEGRNSVSLTASRGADPRCFMLFASLAAVHPDVALVQGHRGYKLLGNDKIESVSAAQPYDDAAPATDQNAYVQSGTSVDHPYTDAGIKGSTYVVGYIDSGIDDLSCFLIDDSETETTRTPGDQYANPITEPNRRKVIQYVAWADGSPAINYDHGTWCSGSTAGRCINATSSANAYNGIAPDAKVTMFDVDVAATDSFLNVPSLYDIALPPAYSAGARVHSNSWGTPFMTSYTSKALDVDEFSYENTDFLFVVAAGNDGQDGYQSVGSPGVSKNALTIGAAAQNHSELVYFSSVGPTFDGAIKPDVVTPGHNLMSAGVRDLTLGQTESCNVQLSSGTSMATPLAAGAAVLVHEYMEKGAHWAQYCDKSYTSCPVVNPNKANNYLSGALVKGFLVHSGQPMAAHQSSGNTIPAGTLGTPPDYFQGWGQVLLKNVLPLPGTYDFDLYVADYQSLASLQTQHRYVTVANVDTPLRVTISWTDPPNVVWAAKNLLNDLDLIVKSPSGKVYYGNNIRGDEHNPLERVVITANDGLEVGEYEIKVVAKQLMTATQNYAIVITSVGSVTESKTAITPADPADISYEESAEACEGTVSNPTGKKYVRFQLEDWESGASWENMQFQVKDTSKKVVATCSFASNADKSNAFYTRSSQCGVCLNDNTEYSAYLDTSKATGTDGYKLVRVATSQCNNVFLSYLQETASFTLRDGSCAVCPSGYSTVTAFMTSNVTDDDYVDYTWNGDAHWTMKVSGSSKVVASGTLIISDAEADRYCVPNGHYDVTLDETVLYKNTGLHAFVTFSSPSASSSVSLTGFTNTLSGSFSVGVDAESWYASHTYTAPTSTGATTPSAYGSSVAQYGSLIAIGAPECVSPCTNGGTVSLYEVYSSEAYRTFYSPNPYSEEKFGFALALNKDYLAVGAIGSAAEGANSGRVYVYSTATFEVEAELVPDANSVGAEFGYALSIFQGQEDFNTPESDLPEWLSVGAPGDNKVYVFQKPNAAGAWALATTVNAPLGLGASQFGRAVSWHTDDLVIAGVDETNAGFVSLYENSNGVITFQVTMYASDSAAGNDFGFSTSLYHVNAYGAYGYVLGVGAPGANEAYVFVRNPSTNQWTQNSKLVAYEPTLFATDANFGSSVSVYEGFIAVGSPGSADEAGYVITYQALNKTAEIPVVHWSQQAVLVASSSKPGDEFGTSVSLYGKNLVGGAPGRVVTGHELTTSGVAQLFSLSETAAPTSAPTAKPSDWYESFTYTATVTTISSTPSAYGSAVAQFGSFVVIGAPECTAPCVSGGAVNVYEVYSPELVKTIYSPNPSVSEKFGFSVTLNKNYFAVGAIGSAIQGTDSGRVYVFNENNLAVEADLQPSAGSAGAQFGYALSIFQGQEDFNTPESDLPEWLSVGAPGDNKVYVFQKPNAAGAWALATTVNAPLGLGASQFGRAVSWHTDDLVIAGVDETNAGFVSLYENSNGVITFQVTMYASDSAAGNDFGKSLSLYHVNAYGAYGYVLGVGAPTVGRAYVFVRNPSTNQWTQNSRLVAPEPNAPEQSETQFGSGVSVYEGYIAVGGPGVADSSGYVVVYQALNRTVDIPVVHWSQQAILIPAANTNGEKYGSSVSMYGLSVLAGSPGRAVSKNGISTTGVAPMFMYAVSAAPSSAPTAQPDKWYETEMYTAPVTSKSGTPSAFGSSVDQYASLVVIGAPECNSPCTSGGSVSLYEVYSPQVVKTFYSPNPSVSEKFGFSVAIDNNYFAVGAIGSSAQGTDSGRVYVYSANTLTLDADILPSAGAAQAKFGYSLAIFQGVDQFNTPESDLPQWLSIGAPGANKVYVYNKASSTSAWAVSDVVNAPLGLGASEFGRAVSWHTDYMLAAGIEQTGKGFANVYKVGNGTLSLDQTLFASDAEALDDFGFSLSMFHVNSLGAYGYVIGAGAPGVNHAYVFVRSPTTNVWTENSMLLPPDSHSIDGASVLFGHSISVYEGLVAVGSPGYAQSSGSLTTFLVHNKTAEIPVVHWSQQAILVPASSAAGDMYGSSASMYGLKVVGGAPGRAVSSNGISTSGVAVMFEFSNSPAPTAAPTPEPGSDSAGNDDDGWSNLDSFNNLAILLLVLGVVIVAVVGFVMYKRTKKPDSLKQGLLNLNDERS